MILLEKPNGKYLNKTFYRGKIFRMIDTKVRYGLLIRSVSQFYLSFALCSILDIYTVS